jgi:hypothetical protein
VAVVSRPDERENAVNEGLRGSRPPQGASWPGELASVAGVEPTFPGRTGVEGSATMLVATCIECRSGAILGGFLGRLRDGDLPGDARIVVLTWDGDPAAWRSEWAIDGSRAEWHRARTASAASAARERLGIGSIDGAEESGVTLLYDADGAWRASYSIGQLNREDIAHDLAVLGD